MRWRKVISLILATTSCLAMFTIFNPSTAQAKLSWNDRRAVVLECFYALRPSHDGGYDKAIYQGGRWNGVSNWNYLYDDPSASVTVRNWYGCLSSNWRPWYNIQNCATISAPSDFFNFPWDYGYGEFGGSAGPVGRGGQCKYFANLILYRAGVCWDKFPDYPSMWNNGESNLATVREGDVILTWSIPNIVNHTAIVVEIKRDYYGNISGVDVIDSNFVTDVNGVGNREIIARHYFSMSYLQNKYRIWRGTSYYGSDYVPWA